MKGRIKRIEKFTDEIQFDIEIDKTINEFDAELYDFKLLEDSEKGNSIIRFLVNKHQSTVGIIQRIAGGEVNKIDRVPNLLVHLVNVTVRGFYTDFPTFSHDISHVILDDRNRRFSIDDVAQMTDFRQFHFLAFRIYSINQKRV